MIVAHKHPFDFAQPNARRKPLTEVSSMGCYAQAMRRGKHSRKYNLNCCGLCVVSEITTQLDLLCHTRFGWFRSKFPPIAQGKVFNSIFSVSYAGMATP
jgi:hypothetical protein